MASGVQGRIAEIVTLLVFHAHPVSVICLTFDEVASIDLSILLLGGKLS